MTSIQAINAQPAFTGKKTDENQYTGLKTSAVYAGMAGAAAYGLKQSIDPLTKLAANLTRNSIAGQNELIKDAFEKIKNVEGSTTKAAENIRKLYNGIIKISETTKDGLYKGASDLFKLRKGAKSLSFLKSFGMSLPFILGMGALVDIGNNYQRKHSAPNATTKNGNEYTKVNMGKKTGFVNGIVSGAAMMLLENKSLNKLGATPVTKALSLAAYGLGGFTLGAIADKLANKKAAKAADVAAA